MVGVCLLCLLDLLCLSVCLSLLFVTMVREIFFYELAIIVCLIPCSRVLLWVLCSPGLTGDELVLLYESWADNLAGWESFLLAFPLPLSSIRRRILTHNKYPYLEDIIQFSLPPRQQVVSNLYFSQNWHHSAQQWVDIAYN